jgi:hypothetical protein
MYYKGSRFQGEQLTSKFSIFSDKLCTHNKVGFNPRVVRQELSTRPVTRDQLNDGDTRQRFAGAHRLLLVPHLDVQPNVDRSFKTFCSVQEGVTRGQAQQGR